MENSLQLVKVVEVFPDCGGDPVRFGYLTSRFLPGGVVVVIGDDDAPDDVPRYFLHVSCRKAYMDTVAHIYRLHNGSDGQSSRVTLAEDGNTFCVHGERCPLRDLTIQELLFPLAAYELATDKPARLTHRYHQ